MSRGQGTVAVALFLLAATEAAVFGPLVLLRTAVAAFIAFYVGFVGLKLVLWQAARGASDADDGRPRTALAEDPDLPRYTVLVPLRGEAAVVGRLVRSLDSLRYPADRLEILLLLEEDDPETQAAVRGIDLPETFQVVIVPDAGPRTKPKACNVGYARATGERIVIYDAEDRPEPDQLLRATAAFRASAARRPDVGCLQAELAFWNPRGSWISSFYWAEYVVHFRIVLAGLARLGLIPPLGGTSNHFTAQALKAVSDANGAWEFAAADGGTVAISGPWDPYNVTEDADLAFRLALAGYHVDTFGSTTYEEAPDTARKARNQRSRWLQGYAHTGLVHSRQPLSAMRRVGPLRYLTFIMLMLGTPLSLLLNPVMWAATLLYAAARLASLASVSHLIDALFPTPEFYAGMIVAVVGNAVLFYQKLLTPLRRQAQSEAHAEVSGRHPLGSHLRQQEYGLTYRMLCTPLWWAFTSLSAYRAVRRLLTRSQRSSWDKTPHGHALAEELQIEAAIMAAQPRSVTAQR